MVTLDVHNTLHVSSLLSPLSLLSLLSHIHPTSLPTSSLPVPSFSLSISAPSHYLSLSLSLSLSVNLYYRHFFHLHSFSLPNSLYSFFCTVATFINHFLTSSIFLTYPDSPQFFTDFFISVSITKSIYFRISLFWKEMVISCKVLSRLHAPLYVTILVYNSCMIILYCNDFSLRMFSSHSLFIVLQSTWKSNMKKTIKRDKSNKSIKSIKLMKQINQK